MTPVEYNIPIPPVARNDRPYRWPFADMRVGGSFAEPLGKLSAARVMANIRAQVRRYQRKVDATFMVTMRTSFEKGVDVVRVWRIAPKVVRGKAGKRVGKNSESRAQA